MTIVLLLIANSLKSKLWILVVVHKTCIVMMTVILAFSVYFTDPQLMQVWFGFFWVVSRCKILTIKVHSVCDLKLISKQAENGQQ